MEDNKDTLFQSIDSVIYRHLNRCTTEAEEQELFAWLEAEEEHRRFYFEIAAIWSAHKTISCRELSQRRDAMMRRLNARIDADNTMRHNRPPFHSGWRRWGQAIVAAAVAVVAVATVWLTSQSNSDRDLFQTYYNRTGEIVSLRLDDGTQVWLQADTELQYAVGKDREERIVRLEGEAYFDVMHNEAHPFVVKTENLGVRVLGTAFNVKAHAADLRVEVVLERGSVRLQSADGGNLVRLHPNQKATYDIVGDDIEVEEIFASHFVTQRYNLVAMKNATIGEIISHIEKSYGVKIRIEDPDNQKRYDINYLRSNSLDKVIDIIEFMTGQHCEVVSGE